MKKFIYLMMAFGLILVSACDPMEDIHNDVNSTEEIITGSLEYSLIDEDYDFLDLNYGNFNSVDDAKQMIPDLLVEKYPQWGLGSLVNASFKVYSPVETYSKNVYELSDAEHNDITGGTYGNFDRDYHIFDYLEATYPDAAEGDFVSLRYRYWSGGESTLTDGFIFENDDWRKIVGFTEEQYKAMEESYPNFSSHDEAALKMPIALIDVYKFAGNEAGDVVTAMYELYKGSGVTKSYTSNFIFDGVSYSSYTNEANETVKFGHDGNLWVPDNTIKYTLVRDNYTLIGDALVGKYPDAGASAANYGNFDRRAGGSAAWTDEMLVEGFNILLDDIHESAEEEQKYTLTFAIYNGSSGTESMSLIKTGGNWVLQ